MAYWTQPLARVLILKSGVRVAMLHDAGQVFLRAFGNVSPHDAPIAHALTLMMRAAETGKRADREAATEQVAVVLRLNRLI